MSDKVRIRFLAIVLAKPAFDVLIPNFERAYPDINVDVTYQAGNPDIEQVETIQLAAGTAPDLLWVDPSGSCGRLATICTLASAGDLVPMGGKPWLKSSAPEITAAAKHDGVLYAYTPIVSPLAIFTNDDLFKRLGLRIPRTFPQLLRVCRRAKAAGAVAFMFPGAGGAYGIFGQMFAIGTLYGKDNSWARKLREGKVTFAGTPGWHQALQHMLDMKNAGCFEPGFEGTTGDSARAQFEQGTGLMFSANAADRGVIDDADPQFAYTFHPFPSAAGAGQTSTMIRILSTLAVNAHVSTEARQAAQTFIDFIARPDQSALYARISGGLTQSQLLHGQVRPFMSDFAPVLARHKYVVNRPGTWGWSTASDVGKSLGNGAFNLLTGTGTIDDVLDAMDEAETKGPR
jgi:raffinose/stachyose/melibiose transport system substrate-binding protein